MQLTALTVALTMLFGAGPAFPLAVDPITDTQSLDLPLDASGLPPPGEKIPGNNFLSLCSGNHENDIIHVTNVDLDPLPIQKGSKLTVNATGSILSEITEGAKAHVRVKAGGLVVYKKTWDVCKELKNAGFHCPVHTGTPHIVQTYDIPKMLPKGSYSAHVSLETADRTPITCVDGKFKL